LVFVDEMGTHTSLAPLPGYSPPEEGRGCSSRYPDNRGTNTTLLARRVGSEGMGASMAVEGSTNKAVFETYLEHFLGPTLKAGQVVIMDNLSLLTKERRSGN
jgi:DDE superfamily endonuclease